MKKFFIASLIGFLPTLLFAQDVAFNTKALPLDAITATGTDPAATTAKAARKEAREARQFALAGKCFNRDFKNASNVNWTSQKDAFVASFTKDNARTVAWYSKSGNLLYAMRTYNPDMLPEAERNVIESDYPNYKMTLVNEVHQADIVVYVVHLENDRNIKLVTVCDGITNSYRDYKKQ